MATEKTHIYDREKTLDWLTALFPLMLIAVFYFRWQAVGLMLLAVAGYLAAAVLLDRFAALPYHPTEALVIGVTAALFFPSPAPLWAPALAGGVAALIAAFPSLVARRWPQGVLTRPLLIPAAVGCLLVWCVFPSAVAEVTMPTQWMPLNETVTSPLAALGDPTSGDMLSRLFLGIHAGGVGEGCVPVLWLSFFYLCLRRRVRLVAPGAMLATVFVLSWMVWGMPVYGLLCGGVMLGALLLSDKTYCPTACGEQTVAGIVAGVTVVLTRVCGGDGALLGVVLACALAPLYPWVVAGCCRAARWLWAQICRFGCWLWAQMRRYAPIAWAAVVKAMRQLIMVTIPAFCRWIGTFVQDKFAKIKK